MLSPTQQSESSPAFEAGIPQWSSDEPDTYTAPAMTMTFNDGPSFRRESRSGIISGSESYLRVADDPPPKLSDAPGRSLFKMFSDDSNEDMDDAINETAIKREEPEVLQPEPMVVDESESEVEPTPEPRPSTPTARRKKTVHFANEDGFPTPPETPPKDKPPQAPANTEPPKLPSFKKRRYEVPPTARRSQTKFSSSQTKIAESKATNNYDNRLKELKKLHTDYRMEGTYDISSFIRMASQKLRHVRVKVLPQPGTPATRRARTREDEDEELRQKRNKRSGSRPWSERTGFDVKRIGQHQLVDQINFRCSTCNRQNEHRTHQVRYIIFPDAHADPF